MGSNLFLTEEEILAMRRSILVLLALFLVSGCASFPKQDPPKKTPGPNSPYLLYVEPTVRIGAPLASQDVDASVTQNLARELHKGLYNRILVTPERTAHIVTNDYRDVEFYLKTGKTVYKVSCTLTGYEKGNGLLRYLFGDWPTWYSDDYAICDSLAGYVALQADCSVTRLGPQETPLLQFTAREKFSGNPHGGLNFFVFSSNYVAGKTTPLLAAQLIKKLAAYL